MRCFACVALQQSPGQSRMLFTPPARSPLPGRSLPLLSRMCCDEVTARTSWSSRSMRLHSIAETLFRSTLRCSFLTMLPSAKFLAPTSLCTASISDCTWSAFCVHCSISPHSSSCCTVKSLIVSWSSALPDVSFFSPFLSK